VPRDPALPVRVRGTTVLEGPHQEYRNGAFHRNPFPPRQPHTTSKT